MADLENLLLQAAGRTGTSGRNNQSRPHSRWRRDDSYSDGSDSKDDDSDNPKVSKRRHPGSQVPLKKRIDPPEKEKRGSSNWREDNDENRLSGDDSDSAPSVGSDLYKDEEDKEELGKMSELDREMILAERSTKIDDYRLKKKARETSSKVEMKLRREFSAPPLPSHGRLLRSDKPAAKSNALNELRAKRMKQQDSEGFRGLRDTTSNRDSSPAMPHRSVPMPTLDSSESEGESEADGRGEDKLNDDNELFDSLEDIKSDTVKYEDIKAITIRRSKLAKWFMEPFFEEIIVGCFVRVGIGKTRSGHAIYRLCMVKNVDATEPDRPYKLENRTTHKWLNCVWGSEASAARWQMAMISDSLPLEDEFKDWVREVERTGGRMPSLKEVTEKKEEIQKLNSYVYSAATVKQMLQEKKSASSRPLNVALEKDRLRKEMEVAKSRLDDVEVERILARMKELEEISQKSKQKDDKAVKLVEMNRKNRAENFKNASEMKPVNTSLKAGEAGYDPFSRRWTRSRNYYVSKPGNDAAANGGDAAAVMGPGAGSATVVGTTNGGVVEAGLAATTAALQAAAGAGKLVDTRAPVDQGTESNTLHNFEIPISLAGLQKFGGPQGAQLGYLARKQKIEATIGFKVLDNDGRRHALTLTVSDYKRRRGLL